MTLVMDASVAAKWLFEEVDSEKARWLLEEARDGNLKLIAPEIIGAEIANVLWKRVYRGELQFREALAHYDRFQRVCPAPVEISLLAQDALKVALQYRHSVCDCLYVSLALKARCDLITADTKLHAALSADLQQVRLLKDWDGKGE